MVDDDEDDRFVFRDALKGKNDDIKVIEFEDGVDFLASLAQLNNLPSAVVLLDINMPRMNGLEVLAALRADAVFKDIPVIIISTASSPDQVQRVYDQGGTGYFVKPHSVEEMEILLEAIDLYFQWSW